MADPSTSSPIERARNVFRRAGGMLRAGQARAAGVHPRTLARMVDEGLLIRVSRGVYQLPDAPLGDPDLAVVALKVPSGVVCLVSALAIHDLTTQIPHAVDVAVPPGAAAPKLSHPPVRYYRFGGASMTRGVEEREVAGTTVRVFGAAKSVADCFKFRNKLGTDIAVEAMRAFLRRRGARADELLHYADVDRVRGVMTPYIEAVL